MEILSLELISDHWHLIDSGGETHKNLVRERLLYIYG